MVIRMRKFQKNQILDIMENIHTIHLRVKEKLGQKEYDTVQTELSDCQADKPFRSSAPDS